MTAPSSLVPSVAPPAADAPLYPLLLFLTRSTPQQSVHHDWEIELVLIP